MTKELLFTLSTGDVVKNAKTGQSVMVGVLTLLELGMISVYDMIPESDWELQKSRFIVTPEELRRIEEYHKKIKEQQENARK